MDDVYHHICLSFPLWPCGKRKTSQHWFIKAGKSIPAFYFFAVIAV
ncbi:hypothetical protein STRCR_2216 [Streptococcus criceti HS-6]|uniref:Uncharacterized protein n=1 Tax=Streptococcus criceti HS-6 TaxID=873449 RepID=G5JSU5_STRCG|nr:hypothetical protein STRCR_2216 [Streptococcus criceti HS-6]